MTSALTLSAFASIVLAAHDPRAMLSMCWGLALGLSLGGVAIVGLLVEHRAFLEEVKRLDERAMHAVVESQRLLRRREEESGSFRLDH